ncbi:UNVERIFIED_CONTAM: zinc finger protein [Trichonephila clavipes]
MSLRIGDLTLNAAIYYYVSKVRKNPENYDDDLVTKQSKQKKSTVYTPATAGQTVSSIEKSISNERRYSCELCNRNYSSRNGLTNHYLVHSQVKPFKCDICDKAFTKKCTLTVHLSIHSTERPHVCEICSRPFARKADLKKHKLIHTNKKSYTCDTCQAEFKHLNYLRKHEVKHLNKESEGKKRAVGKKGLPKHIDEKISVWIKCLDTKKSILDDEKVLKDTNNVKSSEVSHNTKKTEKIPVFPVKENEPSITCESEIITEGIDISQNLETLHSNILSNSENNIQCCNVKQIIKDDKTVSTDQNDNVSNSLSEQELPNLKDNVLNFGTEEEMINLSEKILNSEIEQKIMTNVHNNILNNSEMEQEIMSNLNSTTFNNFKMEQEIITNVNESILSNSEIELELMTNMNATILNNSEVEQEILTKLNNSVLNNSEMEKQIMANLNESGLSNSEMEQGIIINSSKRDLINSAVEQEVIADLNNCKNSETEQGIGNLNDDELNNCDIEREIMANLNEGDLNNPEIEQDSDIEQEFIANINADDLNNSEIDQEIMANLNEDGLNSDIEQELIVNLDDHLNNPEIEQKISSNINDDLDNPELKQAITINLKDYDLNNPERDIIANLNDDDINNDSEIDLEIMIDENDNVYINNSEIEFQLTVDENDNVFINNSEIEDEINKENEVLFMDNSFNVSEDGCNITKEMLNNFPVEMSTSKNISVTSDDSEKLNNDTQNVQALFSSNPLLNDDIEVINLFGEGEFYSCNICDKLFDDQMSLLTHISKHTNEDLSKCYVCDANFNCSDELQSHISSHSDIPIKDMDKIMDEDIDFDFIKFENLTLEEISIGEIDNNDFEGGSEEKIDGLQVENTYKENNIKSKENTENGMSEKMTSLHKKISEAYQMEEDELEIEDSDLLSDISKLNMDKISFNSIFSSKNFNLKDLEILYESDDDDDENSKFKSSKKIRIPVNDIDEDSLKKIIQDIITKLNCDSSSECSEDDFETFVDLSDTDIPPDNEFLEENLILNDVANIRDLPVIDNVAENLNQIVSIGDAVNITQPSLEVNTSSNNLDKVSANDVVNNTANTNKTAEKFSGEISLLSHVRVHIKEASEEVNATFSAEIRTYLKTYEDKLHLCKTCGLKFARRDRLLKHERTHNEKNLFLCENCGSTYESKSEFQTHVLNHTDTLLDDFGCNIGHLGNVDFLDVTSLEPSVQSLKKAYTCVKCWKFFKRKRAFLEHCATHTKEKPYKCETCQKSFGQLSTLKRHVLTHSGTKLFKCDQCEKSFSWKSSLLKHQTKHSSK